MNAHSIMLFAFSLALASPSMAQTSGKFPPAIAAPDKTTAVAILHAEGIQLYECAAGPEGKLAWKFREPIATLILEGKTVGRHYSGPTWEHIDGSVIQAKAAGSAPGETPNDIPWLKLEVTSQRNTGILSRVTTVQRINTRGGAVQGPCPEAGRFNSVPYSADYTFLRAD